MRLYLLFIYILSVLFVFVMARHTFLRGRFFLHIFQQKGYKRREFWHWMVQHWNRRVITPKHSLYLIIITILLWFLSGVLTKSAIIIILTFFAFFWFGPFGYYRGERSKKPLVFTPRMWRLSVPFMILNLLLPVAAVLLGYHLLPVYFAYATGSSLLIQVDIYILALGLVLANVLVPFWVFIAATISQPIENRIHQHFINEAKKKLAQMNGLTVVTITGSYGKTSTKFMIRDLLAQRMSVYATPGSYNTPMGICKAINNELEAHHQVLILEMGARYEGNIDELCDIAQPDIAVVTNVGIAHLETFGSQDAIARTKSTLVKRLPPGGTAVLNFDDERVKKMADLRDDITVISTTNIPLALRQPRSRDSKEPELAEGTKVDIYVSEIFYDHKGTRFTAHYNGQKEIFQTKLLGAHNVQNILLAIGVASRFDVRLKTMAVAARDIQPVEHRLELKKEGGLTIIDDAFNSNPVGAKNAVEILSQFSGGRRIIITPGMIEMGKQQAEANREFGKVIGKAELDLVILVGSEQTKPIREGIEQTSLQPEKVRTVKSLFKANEIIRETARPGDVILYENDLPDTFNE